MDYLKTLGMPPGLRVMDVGCGWGLAGIFCAKNLEANVTCVDADPEVFPFLHLHADLNQVKVSTLQKCYENLASHEFNGIDMLIGADICFWDEMPEQLISMIDRALAARVQLILIADPGRTSFERLAEHCKVNYGANAFNLVVRRPYPISGRILKISNHLKIRHLAQEPFVRDGSMA